MPLPNKLSQLMMSTLLLPCLVKAAEMPADFLYSDKPIDPLCFEEAMNNNGSADLSHCGIQFNQGMHQSGTNNQLIQKIFIGYDYQYNPSPDSPAMNGYSYYK